MVESQDTLYQVSRCSESYMPPRNVCHVLVEY